MIKFFLQSSLISDLAMDPPILLLNKNCSCDAKDLWYFLDHSFELLLIEEDGVVKLFLYLGLGPRLPLSFCTAFRSLCLRSLRVFGRILTCILRTCLLLLSHSSY